MFGLDDIWTGIKGIGTGVYVAGKWGGTAIYDVGSWTVNKLPGTIGSISDTGSAAFRLLGLTQPSGSKETPQKPSGTSQQTREEQQSDAQKTALTAGVDGRLTAAERDVNQLRANDILSRLLGAGAKPIVAGMPNITLILAGVAVVVFMIILVLKRR